MSKNCINRLTLHLIHPPEISGRDAMEKSKACYNNYVENTVKGVLEKYERHDILVNELNIDLEQVVPEEIPDKLYSALERELKKYIREKEILSEISVRIGDMRDPLFRLIEYLKNPQAPWYLPEGQLFDMETEQDISVKGADGSENQSFDMEILAGSVFDKCLTDDNCLKQLVLTISQERRIYQRFCYLIKADTLDLLIRRYLVIYRTGKIEVINKTDKIARIDVIDKVDNAFSDSKVTYTDLYNGINHILSRYPQYRKELREWFFESLLYNNFPEKWQLLKSGFEPVSGRSENELLSHVGGEAMYRLLQQSGFLPKEIKKPEKFIEKTDKIEKTDEIEKSLVKYLLREYKNNNKNFQHDSRFYEIIPEGKQRYLVYNAGLVIFNPMISSFFRHLGYLDKEDNFKSIRSRIRAVHLLQELTGIQSKHYDHLLQLNKIICGLDVMFPIDPEFRITKREKEETADLLKSVIGHWSILKGTSVGGLQESFVQRNGVIEKNGRDWIAHIENKSIDILLNDLPWSFNLLSFPWNDFVIHVDWKR